MKTPEEYKALLNSSYRNFNNGLNEITKSYPEYKINSNSNKIKYLSDVQTLEKIKSDIFLYKNNLENDSNGVRNRILNKNKAITVLNKANTKLADKYSSLENQDFAAGGELVDKHFMYNKYLAQNIILVTIILASMGIYTFNHSGFFNKHVSIVKL